MKLKMALLGLALACLMLMPMAAPDASAEYATASKVYLLSDGGTALSGATHWYCSVERTGYVSNDGEMELNLSVTLAVYNQTGADLTHNYTVRVNIVDSASTTVTDDLDLYVTSNATKTGYVIISNVSLMTLVEDSNASIEYCLLNADSGDAVLDTFTENIPIVSNEAIGPLVAMIPVLISVMVLGAVFSVIGGAFGKMQGMFRMGPKKGKKK
jgi:hypothetical protein